MSLWLILFVLLITACIVGGAHLIVRSKLNDSLLNLLVSMSSGIVLSLALVEFLPKAFQHGNSETPYLILLGILLFLVSDRYITPRLNLLSSGPSCKKTGCKTHDPDQILTSQTACSSIGCLVACAFFDGVELSTALQMSPKTALLMATALFIHLAPTGALAASLSLAGNLGSKNAIKSSQVVTGALVFGIAATLILDQLTEFYQFILPIVTGILLYNVLVHLLPSALKIKWGVTTLLLSALTTGILIAGTH